MSSLHISITAEKIAQIGPLEVSNSMLTSLLVSGIVVLFALLVRSTLKETGKPGRLQTFAELLIEGLYKLCFNITASAKEARAFAPFTISFFLFIVLNNWAGLIPGVGTIGFEEKAEAEHAQVVSPSLLAASQPVVQRTDHEEALPEVTTEDTHEGAGTAVAEEVEHAETSEEAAHTGTKFVPLFRAGTADLNTTIALAIVSVVMTQAFGVAFLGVPYFTKYLSFSSPIMFAVGTLETILEAAKILSFAFRLFGNIFAGEVLLAVMMFLVPVVVPMPFYGLELFVGLIQGLVFSMLSLVFFNLATLGHGDHEEGEH